MRLILETWRYTHFGIQCHWIRVRFLLDNLSCLSLWLRKSCMHRLKCLWSWLYSDPKPATSQRKNKIYIFKITNLHFRYIRVEFRLFCPSTIVRLMPDAGVFRGLKSHKYLKMWTLLKRILILCNSHLSFACDMLQNLHSAWPRELINRQNACPYKFSTIKLTRQTTALFYGWLIVYFITDTLNHHHDILIHLPLNCLFSNLFRLTSNEASVLCVTGPLYGESTGDR